MVKPSSKSSPKMAINSKTGKRPGVNWQVLRSETADRKSEF
ncbi:hypothetical protein FLA_3067 [Filimonas lacunae]|nr:hypothetical protein FLA_3067 [Filimonas lacunae]